MKGSIEQFPMLDSTDPIVRSCYKCNYGPNNVRQADPFYILKVVFL